MICPGYLPASRCASSGRPSVLQQPQFAHGGPGRPPAVRQAGGPWRPRPCPRRGGKMAPPGTASPRLPGARATALRGRPRPSQAAPVAPRRPCRPRSGRRRTPGPRRRPDNVPTKQWTNAGLRVVVSGVSWPMTSMSAAAAPISSLASRSAASTGSSPRRNRPPGKHTSPAWERRCAGRRVSTTFASPALSNSRHSTAAGLWSAWGGSSAGVTVRSGHGRGAGRPSRCRQGPADLVRRLSGGTVRSRAGAPMEQGHPARSRSAAGSQCAGAPLWDERLSEQLAEPAGFEVGHHAPGCDFASLPLHPGSQELVWVGGRDFHRRQTTAHRAAGRPSYDRWCPVPGPRGWYRALQQARGSQGCSWSAVALTGLPSGVGTVVAGATRGGAVDGRSSRGRRGRRSSGRRSSGSPAARRGGGRRAALADDVDRGAEVDLDVPCATDGPTCIMTAPERYFITSRASAMSPGR